ncbi:MAG: hypothetical protein ACREEX_12480 [Caulobacteraceae bacterium]
MSQSGRDAGKTLVVSDISKHFGGVRAISGVGLAVRRGELVSVIGPNGAGKSYRDLKHYRRRKRWLS